MDVIGISVMDGTYRNLILWHTKNSTRLTNGYSPLITVATCNISVHKRTVKRQ
ncbi:hypothetical protein KSS87_003522 [Heliosperma pusillum]|nr:hypothetical protein KSS87_020771 [Heliosperma pusillum]KAH9624752.1 hypothetical protein KSS87_003522 [Heliosperma pusillum]